MAGDDVDDVNTQITQADRDLHLRVEKNETIPDDDHDLIELSRNKEILSYYDSYSKYSFDNSVAREAHDILEGAALYQ